MGAKEIVLLLVVGIVLYFAVLKKAPATNPGTSTANTAGGSQQEAGDDLFKRILGIAENVAQGFKSLTQTQAKTT